MELWKKVESIQLINRSMGLLIIFLIAIFFAVLFFNDFIFTLLIFMIPELPYSSKNLIAPLIIQEYFGNYHF